jgi:hypothetical protein
VSAQDVLVDKTRLTAHDSFVDSSLVFDLAGFRELVEEVWSQKPDV